MVSLRKALSQLDVSRSTLFRIMKLDPKHEIFHVKSVQSFTDAHKKQRIQFYRGLLEQPDLETFVMNVFWIDEKTFLIKFGLVKIFMKL